MQPFKQALPHFFPHSFLRRRNARMHSIKVAYNTHTHIYFCRHVAEGTVKWNTHSTPSPTRHVNNTEKLVNNAHVNIASVVRNSVGRRVRRARSTYSTFIMHLRTFPSEASCTVTKLLHTLEMHTKPLGGGLCVASPLAQPSNCKFYQTCARSA